jgi:hypothetical protein
MVKGKVPWSRFDDRSNIVNPVKFPMLAGKVPDRLYLGSSNAVRVQYLYTERLVEEHSDEQFNPCQIGEQGFGVSPSTVLKFHSTALLDSTGLHSHDTPFVAKYRSCNASNWALGRGFTTTASQRLKNTEQKLHPSSKATLRWTESLRNVFAATISCQCHLKHQALQLTHHHFELAKPHKFPVPPLCGAQQGAAESLKLHQ